jgi:hypothetical protein
MRFRDALLKLVVRSVAASVVLAALAGNGLVAARMSSRIVQRPTESAGERSAELTFGMVGIARGQTLRLNVVALARKGDKSTVDNPLDAVDVPPGPCKVDLSFMDGEGNLILPAVQRTLEIGHASFVDLNRDLLDRPGNRLEIRVMVNVICSTDRGGIVAVPTLEVFDNITGETTFVLNTWAGDNGVEDPNLRR